jgi:DNA-binding CsgD family transcriptional regulator
MTGCRDLRWGQVRELVRLVGEAEQLPVSGGVRRQHTLEGLAAILGSPAAIAVVAAPGSDGTPERDLMLEATFSGLESSTSPPFAILQVAGCGFNPAIQGMYAMAGESPIGTPVVAAEDELVDPKRWRDSPYFVDFVRPADLDHFLIPARWVPPEGAGHFGGFFRCRGDRGFDERDRNLLELFVLEAAHLLWPETTIALPRRLRETLDRLLRGMSAKQVARDLGLSVHTVNEYIGELYRRYGVHSRGELYARVGRNGIP